MSPGCSSCFDNTENMCYECVDKKNTYLIGGLCVCPKGMYLNGHQMCDTCKVPGCGKCTDESDEVC